MDTIMSASHLYVLQYQGINRLILGVPWHGYDYECKSHFPKCLCVEIFALIGHISCVIITDLLLHINLKIYGLDVTFLWWLLHGYQVNSGPSEFGTKWTRDQVVNSGLNIFGTRWIRDQTLGEFGTKFFLSYKYVNTGISYLVWVPFPTYFIAPLFISSHDRVCSFI